VRVLAPKDTPLPEGEYDQGKLEMQSLNATDDGLTCVRRDVPGFDCGWFMTPKKTPDIFERAGLKRPEFAAWVDTLACPTLLAAGSHPYRRILLPVLDPDAAILAAELAIDISKQLDVEIAAVVVSPPTFIVGQEAVDEKKEALKTVMEIAPYTT
jgi:hypothetical protein